jgi:hypothetical protein
MALGLLVDGKIDLAMSIVEHCIFEIKHYNKVLNGNRSYVSLHDATSLKKVPRPIATPLLYRPCSANLQSARPEQSRTEQSLAKTRHQSCH